MYFLKRTLQMLPVLLIVSFIGFVLIHAMPGGPFDSERKPASEDIERNLKAKFHLDEPVWKQYLRYLGLAGGSSGLINGDLGPSLKYRNHNVNDIIKQCLPVSMTLGVMSFCFAMFTGIPLGCYMALRRGEWGDHLGGFIAMLSFCIPNIVIAPLLILWLAVKLHLLPVALWGSPSQMILPTIVLGLYFSGRIARLMREGLSTTLHSEFVTTARAKGVSESAILWKHAFRLAILPVVSYSGPLLADLLTGSFVVENIFQIPGIGVFFINSIFNRDHTMTVGLVLVYAALLLVLNMLVDLSYSLLDRRVRYE
ncbi:MAG: ABC transporter permease [Verrucomicrobiota bacterium]